MRLKLLALLLIILLVAVNVLVVYAWMIILIRFNLMRVDHVRWLLWLLVFPTIFCIRTGYPWAHRYLSVEHEQGARMLVALRINSVISVKRRAMNIFVFHLVYAWATSPVSPFGGNWRYELLATILPAILAPEIGDLLDERFSRKKKEQVSNSNVIRGRTLRDVSKLKEQYQGKSSVAYPWGGILVPATDLDPHYAVVGVPKSGKTLTIRMLMRSVLLRGEKLVHRALVYDPKRDMYPTLLGMGVPRNKIVILNPFDARGTAWDVAADVTSFSEAIQFASLLMPKTEKEHQYFSNVSRDIVSGVIQSFVRFAPGQWSLNDIIEATATEKDIRSVLDKTTEGKRIASVHLKKNAPVTAANIVTSIRSLLAPIATTARLWERLDSKVSLRTWVRDLEPTVLLLGSDDSRPDVIAAVNRVLFDFLGNQLNSRPGDEPDDETWLFIDEMRTANDLTTLNQVLLKSRSKGGHVVLGLQDVEGLHGELGKERANEVLALCGNMTVLRLNSPVTMSWASEYFGSYEEWQRSTSASHTSHDHGYSTTTESFQIVKRQAVLEQEFRNFPITSKANGIAGVFAAPPIGSWSCIIPPQFIDQHLFPLSGDRGFMPRPRVDEDPINWNDNARIRLGLIDCYENTPKKGRAGGDLRVPEEPE